MMSEIARDHWVKLNELELAYEQQMEAFNDEWEPLNDIQRSCIDKCITQAHMSAFYAEDYVTGEPPDCLRVAAALLFYLAKDHCLHDGNKRVAWQACVSVLRRGGFGLDVGEREAEKFVKKDVAANQRVSVEVVGEWLYERLC